MWSGVVIMQAWLLVLFECNETRQRVVVVNAVLSITFTMRVTTKKEGSAIKRIENHPRVVDEHRSRVTSSISDNVLT